MRGTQAAKESQGPGRRSCPPSGGAGARTGRAGSSALSCRSAVSSRVLGQVQGGAPPWKCLVWRGMHLHGFMEFARPVDWTRLHVVAFSGAHPNAGQR